MNPDTIGCVWTGEFDLNTLRVEGEIFESGKKKLRIQKYLDTCGRGLSSIIYVTDLFNCNMSRCNLRNADDFSLPRCNTVTYGRHSLRYLGPFIGRSCITQLNMADSLNLLKMKSN